MACPINDSSQQIIVDNTNTTVAEIAPYIALAKAFGANVHIHLISNGETVDDKLHRGVRYNTHKVPPSTIFRMLNRINYTFSDRGWPRFWPNYQEVANNFEL